MAKLARSSTRTEVDPSPRSPRIDGAGPDFHLRIGLVTECDLLFDGVRVELPPVGSRDGLTSGGEQQG